MKVNNNHKFIPKIPKIKVVKQIVYKKTQNIGKVQ